MSLSMAVLLALVLAPAAIEAESKKKIELMLDMSISKVIELKGMPITRVNLGDTTTVLSYDDIILVFRDDKLAGQLSYYPAPPWEPLKTIEEISMEMMRKGGIPPEEIKKFKETYSIPTIRSGQADSETIELTLGMSIAEVKKLKGLPNTTSIADIGGKGLFHSCQYDDIKIIFRDGKLFSVRVL